MIRFVGGQIVVKHGVAIEISIRRSITIVIAMLLAVGNWMLLFLLIRGSTRYRIKCRNDSISLNYKKKLGNEDYRLQDENTIELSSYADNS